MHRLYLTLLLAFLLSHFAANAQPLMLTGVSVDTIFPQQIKLTWLFEVPGPNCPQNPESITILKRDATGRYQEVAIVKMTEDALSWIDTTQDQISENYYYRITWLCSGSEHSTQTNIFLDTLLRDDNDCRNAVSLSWNPYINMMDTLDYYIILYREIKNGISSPFMSTGDTIKGDNNLTDRIHCEVQYLANNTEYEFVIQAVSKNDTVRVFSNIVKYKTGFEINTPIPVQITCVSVIEDNYIEIDVQTGDFSEQPFQKLYLFRDKYKEVWNKDSLSFKVIDSMEYKKKDEYRFKDENVNPKSGFYYYMAVADNKCRVNDISNVLTNIFLYGRRVDKYTDSIFFSQVMMHSTLMPYNYSLFRVVYDEKRYIKGGYSIINKNSRDIVNVMHFMEDGAAMKYLIVSDNDCLSNSLIIDHEPLIRLPNSFYPLSMNIENRTFYPILKFPPEISQESIDEYLFIIYNRWGQEVYRSNKPPEYGNYENADSRWDGTFRGNDCPPGLYAFKISYTFNQRAGKYSDTGSFMLVR